MKQWPPSTHWPLYELRPEETYVNVGFWGTVPLKPGQVYIAKPYPFLGGSEAPETYGQGDVWVFLDIVAQAHGF